MTRTRLLTIVSAVAVLALTVAAGWLAARLGASGRQVPAQPPRATATPGTTANMVVADQVAPLKRVVPPDAMAVVATGVRAQDAARIRRIKKVRDVIVVDGGAVSLGGRQINVFAVDPSEFRSWTPPATAKDQRLWAALAADRFVAAGTTARSLGLELGRGYQLPAGSRPDVVLGGTAALGIPDVDLLVSRRVGDALGLIPGVAIMVNAPGLDPAVLVKQLSGILGSRAKVIDLQTEQRQTGTSYLDLYKKGATVCPGLSWTVLAAIGQIESGHGRNVGPSSAGALGPMQFMPATWKTYGVDGDGDGKADIMDPYDAIPAAAKYLCAAGAQHDLYRAVFAYNHADWYVQKVLALAKAYARQFS